MSSRDSSLNGARVGSVSPGKASPSVTRRQPILQGSRAWGLDSTWLTMLGRRATETVSYFEIVNIYELNLYLN